ncbi:hypothetical protein LINPERPRIM_LOCUS3418 [Linum perenne]
MPRQFGARCVQLIILFLPRSTPNLAQLPNFISGLIIDAHQVFVELRVQNFTDSDGDLWDDCAICVIRRVLQWNPRHCFLDFEVLCLLSFQDL